MWPRAASRCGDELAAPPMVSAAPLIGVGAGLVTPLGFAGLAATAPRWRLGQTMGAAELGREAGDAGGPLLVGAVATAVSPTAGLAALGTVAAVAALVITFAGERSRS